MKIFPKIILILGCIVVGTVFAFYGRQPSSIKAQEPTEDVTAQVAIGTAFSYQGSLNDGGNPANGKYDLTFKLYNAASGGSQVGAVTASDVSVSNGVFTTHLDFGNVFDGQAYWLEISVRPGNSGGNFTTLNPRQPLFAVPYAMFALNTSANNGLRVLNPSGNGLYVENAGNDGVQIQGGKYSGFAAFNSGTHGVFVENPKGDGLHIVSPTDNGLEIRTAQTDGIYLYQPKLSGIRIDNAGSHGLYVNSASAHGVFVEKPKGDGLHIVSPTDNGLEIQTAQTDGIYLYQPKLSGIRIDNAGSHGLNVNNANHDGVHVAGANRYGVYSEVSSANAYAGYFTGGRGVRTNILEITGGSDLAEPFEVNTLETIEPGMVVAIDAEQPGQLRLADRAYDRTVAGVISGAGGIKPGLTMQQENTIAEGSHPVSLTGRVYVKVDAAYGAIQPGDLLTTSDTPGHAMKVADYERAQGAILGKAMSSLVEGQGLVLVLVSLQ